MTYSDFRIEQVTRLLGVTTAEAELFAGAPPIPPPAWLLDLLDRRTQLATLNEKARSEFIVVPILLATRELSPTPLAIFSGHCLDVDSLQGLAGECDFILAAAPPVLPLRSPLVTIVEAEQNDIEGGLGQCISQMVGAARFNQAAGDRGPVFGCVTTGEVWQFLRLDDAAALIDRRRYFLDNLPGILAALQATIARSEITPPG